VPFDHFDWIAPVYKQVTRYDQLAHMLEYAALPSPGGLLDAGGGTGRVAGALLPHVGWAVVADLSLGMLRQAAEKDGLGAVRAPSEGLPFPDETFERVVMVDTLHHVVDQEQTVSELWRVLKPGGRIVIQEPDVRRWGVKLIAAAEKILLMRSRFLDPGQMAVLFDGREARVTLQEHGHTAWLLVDKE
jgi:ubiquinone/menaquinone biosynthesis C-methylase UbiE